MAVIVGVPVISHKPALCDKCKILVNFPEILVGRCLELPQSGFVDNLGMLAMLLEFGNTLLACLMWHINHEMQPTVLG
jgi:hypothetical protein